MCRTSPIDGADLVKGVILDDSLDVFRVAGSYQDFLQPSNLAQAAKDPNIIAAQTETDKHRIVWLINVEALEEVVGRQEHLRLAHAESPDLHNVIFKAGTFHVLVSAPRADYARFRMTLAPKSPTCGEHFLVVLPWVGDVLFHHAALRTKQLLGPVVALFGFNNPATSTAGENFFNGEIPETSVNEFEKQQGLKLSPEQPTARSAHHQHNAKMHHAHQCPCRHWEVDDPRPDPVRNNAEARERPCDRHGGASESTSRRVRADVDTNISQLQVWIGRCRVCQHGCTTPLARPAQQHWL